MNGCSATANKHIAPAVTLTSHRSAPSSSTTGSNRHLATDGSNKAYGKVHEFLSSKKKDEDSSTTPSNKVRDVPRTIIVKRGDLTNPSTTTAPAQPMVGKLKPRFPLERQIRDSQGKTIWIPASKMLEYPIVRANALLDSSTYVRSGGDSIAGTEAARRLLHGKKDLIVLLRYVQRPTLLQGHGIPSQLLDHLLESALALLNSTNAANILRWEQTNDGRHDNEQILAEWCVENLKQIQVDGNIATMSELYFESAEDLLLLYWTVMDRIVKRLCFKRVPSAWNVEFRRKESTTRVALLLDYKRTDASVTLRGNKTELVFQAVF